MPKGIKWIHTLLLHPTAKPIAVLSKPSIPLAPLFPATDTHLHGNSVFNIISAILWLSLFQLHPYISASRITMLFPIKRALSDESASEITCAIWGSDKECSAETWNNISCPTYNKWQQNFTGRTKEDARTIDHNITNLHRNKLSVKKIYISLYKLIYPTIRCKSNKIHARLSASSTFKRKHKKCKKKKDTVELPF